MQTFAPRPSLPGGKRRIGHPAGHPAALKHAQRGAGKNVILHNFTGKIVHHIGRQTVFRRHDRDRDRNVAEPRFRLRIFRLEQAPLVDRRDTAGGEQLRLLVG